MCTLVGPPQVISVSQQELDRAGVVSQVMEGQLLQADAAQRLGLSTRQVRRLCRRYESEGLLGLVSKRRGRPSNRRLPASLRDRAMSLVAAHYHDFGPTLAHEKLTERHGLALSVTTLRRWMVETGYWVPRKARDPRPYQPRRRRPCRGELIQIDGCDHEWFEDRGPRCVLLVFVDDATGALMDLRFTRSESTFEYFGSVRRYLATHGRPVAFYSDKASIFRVNQKDHGGTGLTQFGRAMRELNIDIICANSAPAKGRVERAHLTLQDRLVKELRLAGVCDIEAANRFLPAFIADYNRRFARAPHSPHDAHRPLPDGVDLDTIFSVQVQRKVTRNLTLHHQRVMYVLDPTSEAMDARGKRVTVLEDADGTVTIVHKGHVLAATPWDKVPRAGAIAPGEIVASKLLGGVLSKIRDTQLREDEERVVSSRTRREREMSLRRLRKASTG